MRVSRGPLGIPSRRCWGLRPCVESVLEPEHSSPVLSWILGYFWSLPRGVSPPLERAGGNGATLDMGGTLGFLLSGDGYVGELLELQQGCEGPLEVPELKCDYPLVASA